MKKIMMIALTFTIFSTSAMSSDFVKNHGEAIGVSYVGLSVAMVVYGSIGPVAGLVVSGTMAAAVTKAELKERQANAAKLLINDVQDFYQQGVVSVNLQRSVDLMREADAGLSESEALDSLTQSATLILQ